MITPKKKSIAMQLAVLCSLTMLGGAVGCGNSPQPELSPVNEAHLKTLGILYGKFLSSSQGRPPADEAQFTQFLSTKKTNWEKIVDSPSELLISPNDGKPFVVLYGQAFQPNNSEIAYEQQETDGMHRVISFRGGIKQLESAEVESLFKAKKE